MNYELTKFRAIVLHSFKLGDSKLIADMLTPTLGRVQCVVRVSKSARGGMRRQLFQPLTLLEVVAAQPRTGTLMNIKEARMLRPNTSIPFEPVKLSLAMFTAELLMNATRGELADEAMFDYIEKGLLWLDECLGPLANFHIVFAIRLTRFLGFYPNTEDYREGDWFDLRSGCFTPTAPFHHDRLAPDEARLVGLMLRMNFATMHLFHMTRDERNRLLDIVLQYYRIHQPGFREMKSVEVLREVASEN